ncbi:MAG: hypothetical protein AAGA99_19520 [Actinomycetota bacterium]
MIAGNCPDPDGGGGTGPDGPCPVGDNCEPDPCVGFACNGTTDPPCPWWVDPNCNNGGGGGPLFPDLTIVPGFGPPYFPVVPGLDGPLGELGDGDLGIVDDGLLGSG